MGAPGCCCCGQSRFVRAGPRATSSRTTSALSASGSPGEPPNWWHRVAFVAGRPACEETERFGRPGGGLGAVGDDHRPGVGHDFQPVEAELQLADDRVVEVLGALAVPADVCAAQSWRTC